jgi:hypothetical protein
MGVRHSQRGWRYDVWTNAGRPDQPLYPLAFDVSTTVAYALKNALTAQGWSIEFRDAELIWAQASYWVEAISGDRSPAPADASGERS